MKITKSVLSAVLALSILSGVITSCGGSAQDAGAKDPASGAESVSVGETSGAGEGEAEEKPEYIPPENGLGGREIRYAAVKYTETPFMIQTYNEAFAEELNGDPLNDAIFNRTRYVEEALDCKIVPVLYETITPMVNATLAGDSYCEIMTVSGSKIPELLYSHLLIDLNTIDTLDLSASWWDQNSVRQLSIANKLFSAAGNLSTFSLASAYAVYVNKGILESYDLEAPYEAVRNGKWTFDMMGEMAKAVAHDLNGDGVPGVEDMYGMSSENIGMVALNAAGCVFTEKDENDIPMIVLQNYDVSGALEKFVPMFRDKNLSLYANDYYSKYNNVFRELFVEKFIADELLFINSWVLIALEMRNMESDFGILPPPKGSEEQPEYIDYGSEWWRSYAVVPLTVSDTDPVGYAMDALGYYGKTEIYTALIDTTITDKTIRDTDTEEMLQIIYDNCRYDLAGIFDWGGITSMTGDFIGKNKTDFASVWAKQESKVLNEMQKSIDELMG